jgi:hypothetical protein
LKKLESRRALFLYLCGPGMLIAIKPIAGEGRIIHGVPGM